MVAHLMALGEDALVEFRVFAHVVADQEEGALDVELAQGIENEGGCLGDGAVVESQVH